LILNLLHCIINEETKVGLKMPLQERLKGRKPKGKRSKPLLRLHIQRVHGELRVSPGAEQFESRYEAPLPIRLLLNEMSPYGVELYLPENLPNGIEVSITLEKPRRFFCRGVVVSSQYQESRIISAHRYSYRLGLEFVFHSPEEEKAVRDFWEEVNQEKLGKLLAA
jgi:hypothetical protein